MTIKAAFDEIRNEIDQIVIDATERLAKEGLKAVVDNSPVESGAYVNSHRISIDGASIAPALASPPRGTVIKKNAATEKAKAMNAQRLKIKGIRLFSNVTILNQAEHAAQVEYIGWEKTPAYGVYMRAESYLKAIGTLEL